MKRSDIKGLGLSAWFVVAMIIPNIVIAAVLGTGVWPTMASIALPLGFYCIWGGLLPASGIMILLAIPLMFLAAFQLVLLYLFKDAVISSDMFANLMTTSLNESTELLRNIYPVLIFIILTYLTLIGAAVYAIVRRHKISEPVRRWSTLLGAMVMCTGAIVAISLRIGGNSDFRITADVFPCNVIYNHLLSRHHWFKVHDYKNTSSKFAFRAKREKKTGDREIYVLVVGESSRAFSWSAYGYGRKTTPHLDTTKNICWFKSMLTQSNATYKSVPLMLCCINAGTYDYIYGVKSIVELFSDAGFRTAVISNQSPDGAMIDNFYASADTTLHMLTDGTLHTDGDMLPVLERIISCDKKDLLVIVHTYGSHFNYRKRYPDSFSHFVPDRFEHLNWKNAECVVNAYDNSILYTDSVLSSIIKLLEKSGACSAMIYCSDHGEDLFDDSPNRFLHSSSHLSYYQLHIPCFCWISDKYADCYPKKVSAAKANSKRLSSTSTIFHTVSDMASIKSPYVCLRFSLVSDQYDPANVKYYLNDKYKAVKYHNSGINKALSLLLIRFF